MKLLRITTVPISLQLLLTGQFRYMGENGFDVYTISADGPEVAEVLKEGVRHIAIPFTRKITVFHDIGCLYRLVRVIRQVRPDIIHTHTPKAGLLGMIAGWICQVPVRMHTVAGLPLIESRGMRRRILKMTERMTYACAQQVYPNSRGLERFILDELRADATKIRIIGKGSSNGIDTHFFSRTPTLETQASDIRRDHGIARDDIVFSFVGRIVKDKGIVELVTAFRMLMNQENSGSDENAGPRFFLMLVGSFEPELDPLPEEVMRFLKEDARVIMAGFQRDVRPWIMASDVFVFPSYREGFPNVVMQACLLEVPCIASDINGCNEIIDHSNTGLIVPPKNVGALADAMKTLAGDAPGRRKFATIARAFVSENFRRELIWEELRKEYGRLGGGLQER